MLCFFSNFLFVSLEHRICKQSAIIIIFIPVNTVKEKREMKRQVNWTMKGKVSSSEVGLTGGSEIGIEEQRSVQLL